MNAAYHALQFSVEKRMGKYFGLKSFYTFSKSLEDVQLDNNTLNGGAQDYRNLAEERGRSDNDRTHNSATSLIWNLNYYGGSSAFVRNVLNGWMISGVVTLRSGLPFTVTTGKDNNLDGNNNDRANLVGDPHLDPNRSRSAVTGQWFNTAAFVANPVGTDGTSGRNILDGPGQRSVDIGIFRTFRFKERMGLEFRAESTNAFNLVSLANSGLTSNLNSNLFGTVRQADAMRQVQLGMRLTF